MLDALRKLNDAAYAAKRAAVAADMPPNYINRLITLAYDSDEAMEDGAELLKMREAAE